MTTMPGEMTMNALQQAIAAWERATGFSAESPVQKCLLLGEEVGELFKAVRSATGMGVDPQSKIAGLEEELADVMIFVVAIANRFQVNLDGAVRSKLAKNNSRRWR